MGKVPNFTESVAWLDSPSVLEDAVQRVRDVRGLGLDVGVDFHGRLHKSMSKQLIRLLEEHKPFFVEGRHFYLVVTRY